MKKLLSIITILTLLMPHASYAKVDKDVNVAKVQAMLAELCYEPGIVDGAWGKKTETAVKAFFAKHYRKYDGNFDVSDANFILSAGASAKAFGSASVKKCLVVYSDRIGNSSNNEKIKQITQKVANNKIKQNKNNLSVSGIQIFKGRTQIPSDLPQQANDATISHYYKIGDNFLSYKNETYTIHPSLSPIEFSKSIEQHKIIDRELSKSAIFSYLYFDDGEVIYDALPPKGRYSMELNNSSYFQSHSMGKSITSYLIGHAICQGYIQGVNAKILDWPYMESTLYYGQPLINLLNMTAGDTHIIKSGEANFIKTGRNIHGNAPLIKAAQNPKELQNTSRNPDTKFKYSNLTADVLFNYLMFRVGEDFEKFIKEIYQEKIRIEYPVILAMNPIEGVSRHSSPSMKTRIKQGAGVYGISATRYDYLRIAKAILDDWNNDTCVGKYLKKIYDKRISTNERLGKWDSSDRRYGKTDFFFQSRNYAGQFYTDVKGLKDRFILVMIGANGQQIVIDMDGKKIIVINGAIEKYYDSYKLGYEPIKYGRIR